MPGYFEDVEVGQVVSLGQLALDEETISAFADDFAPGWDPVNGAPDALIYAIWSRLDHQASGDWPQTKRLAVDALRWARNPPAGETPWANRLNATRFTLAAFRINSTPIRMPIAFRLVRIVAIPHTNRNAASNR